jgi:hypothetical protein
MISRIFCVALALLAASASASTNSAKATPVKASYDMKSLAGPRAMADQIMKDVVAGRMGAFVDFVLPHTAIPRKELEAQWQKTAEQRDAVQARFGRIIGYTLLGETKAGEIAVRYLYVEKRANHIIRWQFTFYKPTDTWKFNAFLWDDNIAAIFE